MRQHSDNNLIKSIDPKQYRIININNADCFVNTTETPQATVMHVIPAATYHKAVKRSPKNKGINSIARMKATGKLSRYVKLSWTPPKHRYHNLFSEKSKYNRANKRIIEIRFSGAGNIIRLPLQFKPTTPEAFNGNHFNVDYTMVAP